MRNANVSDIEQIRKTGVVPTNVVFMTPFGLRHAIYDEADGVMMQAADGRRMRWMGKSCLQAVPKKPSIQNKRKKYKRPSGNGFTNKEQFEPYLIYPVGTKVVLANGKKSKIIFNDRTCDQAYYCTTEGWTDTNGKSIISPEYDITHVLVTEKTPTTIGFGGYESVVGFNGDSAALVNACDAVLSFKREQEQFQLSFTAEELVLVYDILGGFVTGSPYKSRRKFSDSVYGKIGSVMRRNKIEFTDMYTPEDLKGNTDIYIKDSK